MGMESLIPLGLNVVGALAKGGGGGGQQAPQGMAPQAPVNPFPENHPDGGVRQPSILDILRLAGGGSGDAYPAAGQQNPLAPKQPSIFDFLGQGGPQGGFFNGGVG